MTDEEKNLTKPEQETEEQPPAEAKKPDSEIPFNKARFDEINQKLKDAEKRATAAEKAAKKVQEERLKEQEDYKTLYEEALGELNEVKPQAEKLEAYQNTLKQVLEAQIEGLPEEVLSLIPENYSTKDKLDWLAKNKNNPLIAKPKPFDIGAGKRGGSDNSAIATLTPEQKQAAMRMNVSQEDYAKSLAAIRK